MTLLDVLKRCSAADASEGPAVDIIGSALWQVFQTPELCELILLAINDIKTLLRAWDVSRQLRTVIKGSIAIQRMLWFQSDAARRVLTPGIYSYKPFISINPFFLRYFTDKPRASPPFMAVYPGKMAGNTDKVVVSCDINVFNTPKGNWRDMLIAEGGKAELDVPLVCFCYDGASYNTRVASFEMLFRPEMTAGQLIDELRRKLETQEQGMVVAWMRESRSVQLY